MSIRKCYVKQKQNEKKILNLVNDRIKNAKEMGMSNNEIADIIDNIIDILPVFSSSELVSILWKLHEKYSNK